MGRDEDDSCIKGMNCVHCAKCGAYLGATVEDNIEFLDICRFCAEDKSESGRA